MLAQANKKKRRQKHRKANCNGFWNLLKLCLEKRGFMAATCSYRCFWISMFWRTRHGFHVRHFIHFFCRSLLQLFDPRAWRTGNLCLRKAILVRLRAALKSAERSRSWGALLWTASKTTSLLFFCVFYLLALLLILILSYSCNHTTCASDPPSALPGTAGERASS